MYYTLRTRCFDREAENFDDNMRALLELTASGNEDLDFNLFTRTDGTGGLRLRYDSARRVCAVDRSGMDLRFNQQVGEALEMPLENGLKRLNIFIDRSSCEIFANDGVAE